MTVTETPPVSPPNFSVVFQAAGLPEDTFLLEGITTDETGPFFNVTEAAKVFFGRSGHWIRWRERGGHLELDGERVGTGRSKGERGYRKYSLGDIEQMAHAMAQSGAIDGTQLLHTLRAVQAVARIYGYLPPEWEPEPEEDDVDDVG